MNSNLYFSLGLALLKHSTEAKATSWNPDRISLSLPGYEQISPAAKIPFLLVSKFSEFTSIVFFVHIKPPLCNGTKSHN